MQLREPARAGQHVRQVGESVLAGEELVAGGRVLRPADLSVLAAGGLRAIDVRRRPVVTIVPTGDEVRPLGVDLAAGQLVDTNSLMLAATLREIGCDVRVTVIQPDDPALIAAAVRAAAADLVLVPRGLQRRPRRPHRPRHPEPGRRGGAGVAVRPAHPVLLGVLNGAPGVPVIGVPGYPVSAALAVELFAVPLLVDLQRRHLPRSGRSPRGCAPRSRAGPTSRSTSWSPWIRTTRPSRSPAPRERIPHWRAPTPCSGSTSDVQATRRANASRCTRPAAPAGRVAAVPGRRAVASRDDRRAIRP